MIDKNLHGKENVYSLPGILARKEAGFRYG